MRQNLSGVKNIFDVHQKFPRTEGLDHIIVSPQLEADYLVGNLVLGGEHDDWQMGIE